MARVLGVRYMRVAGGYVSVVSYGGHRSDGHGRGGSSVRPDQVAMRGCRQHGVKQRPRGGAGGQDTAKDNYLK